MLHRRLSKRLTSQTLEMWLPKLERNLERERESVRGSVHLSNVDRWTELVRRRDLSGLRRVLTGLDRDSIEMREVSPMGGLLPEEERLEVMHELREAYLAPRSA